MRLLHSADWHLGKVLKGELREQTDWENFLQVPEKAFVENLATQVTVVGRRLFEQFFEDRSLIPPENFIETLRSPHER